MESFKYHINYFYNYLLLFCLLYKNKDIQNARITLGHLNSEIKEVFILKDFSLFHLQKYNTIIIEYIKFLSSYLSCIYKLGTDYNYEEIFIKYLEIIEAIPDNKIILSHLYFYCGQLMIEMNYLGLGIKCYEYANFNTSEYASRLKSYKLIVSILYNKSLLEYVFYDENNRKSDKCIESLIEAKNTKLKEIEVFSPKNTRGSHHASISQFRRNSIKMIGDITPKKDHQLLDIYMLLFEFDYKNKNYDVIDDYVTFIEANSRHLSSEMTAKAKFILSKIAEMQDNNINDTSIKTKVTKKSTRNFNLLFSDNKAEKPYLHSSRHIYNKKNSSNEENFINFCLPQRKHPLINQNEIIEFQKFFIFLTKLSAYQIELLNQEQPDKKNYKKFKSLPIYFSANFKQSLNLEQMKLLNNIKILMLKRKLVLKNVDHLIMVDNLNYELIYKYEECSVPITQLNNLHSINQKKIEFNEFNEEMIKNAAIKKEKKNSVKEIDDNNNQIKFKFQDRIQYESLKANLKKKYKSNNNFTYPIEEVIKDNFIIELLNRMKYKEVKMLNDNPDWLLEILVDYKKKIEKDERSSVTSKEEKDKNEEKIMEPETEKEESSVSDKGEVEQKKSNDFLDAMKIGKDE